MTRIEPFALALLVCVACGDTKPHPRAAIDEEGSRPVAPASPRMSPLVSVDWLVAHRGGAGAAFADSVVILDARSPAEYAQGHIPGARNLPSQIMEEASGNIRNIAPVHVINQRLGEVGVDMDTTVVIYGAEDYRPPSRLFWVLEVHGHPAVAVLDGGVAAWRAAGLPLRAGTSETWQRKDFVASLRPEILVDKLAMYRAMSDEKITVVDARSRDEYAGVTTRGSRKGHIPTALHLDSHDHLLDDGTFRRFKPIDELASVYTQIDRTKKVYAYCQIGWLAAMDYLVLRLLGYDVAVYDGSWHEWSADSNLPITTGSVPGEPTD